MKMIFAVQDVYEKATNGVESLPANATKVHRNAHKDVEKKDNKTLFLIHQCVEVKMLQKIAEGVNFKEAWNILLKSDKGDAKVMKLKLQALKRQYKLIEMKIGEKFTDYFPKLVTLTNQMKNCGEET